MTKIVSDPEHFIRAILSKQNTFLQSESSYMKVFLDESMTVDDVQIMPTYLFASAKLVYDYCRDLNVLTKLLIQTLTPGPIQVAVNSNGKLGDFDKFIAYIPDSSKVQSLLLEIGKPVRADFILENHSLTLTLLQSLFADQELVVLQDDITSLQVLPTLIDCTNDEVQVCRPGVISYEELRKILPRKTVLRRNYSKNNASLDLKIQEVSVIDKTDPQMAVVMGTKESLQEAFSLHFLDYFHHKQMGNFILFNIGSSTSSQNIAVNLHKNIEEISRLGIEKVQIIKQNWPKNKWGEIIRYYFDSVVTPESVDHIVDESFGKLKLASVEA
jgi:hypothetical protein